MILQEVTSNEWISTSNEQRVKSYASSLKLKGIHYLRANFLKIYFQFLTLDRQCNGFLRKIFCTITNFHNKLSKIASSNRIHLIFNAPLFSNKSNFYKSAKRSTKSVNLTLTDASGRIKILMFIIISSDFRVCWQIIKRNPESFEKSTKIGPEKEDNLWHQKLHMLAKNVLCC